MGVSEHPGRWHVPDRTGVYAAATARARIRRGYGAAASWALQAGAEHVVLITDLSNPISNAIYPRIGFRPVYDAVEIAFDRRSL